MICTCHQRQQSSSPGNTPQAHHSQLPLRSLTCLEHAEASPTGIEILHLLPLPLLSHFSTSRPHQAKRPARQSYPPTHTQVHPQVIQKKNDEVTLLDRPIYDNAGRKVTAQKLGLEGVTYLECDVAYAKEIRKEFLEAETDGRSVREGKILLLWMCYQKYPSLFW